MPPPEEAVYAADFVAAICGESPDYQDRMKQAEPHVWKPLRPASPPPLSADEIRALRASALRPVEGLQVVAFGWRQAGVSPLLGKLWQESDLRAAPNQAVKREAEGVLEICATPAYVRDRGKVAQS
jgi:hypothetical protein